MASHTRRHPTRGLTEGAILAALTAVIAAAGLLFPPVAVLLAPLPIMLLVIRWGMRIAVLATIIAAAALFQFTGPVNAASAVAAFAPLGLALGWGVRRGMAAQWTILIAAVPFLLSLFAMVAAGGVLLHQDLIGDLITIQVKAMQTAVDVQQRLGVPSTQVAEVQKMIAVLPHLLRTMLPVAFGLGALLWSYLSYTVARSVLRRVGHPLPAVPPIVTWRLPPALASVMLWAGAILSLAAVRAPQFGGAAFDAMLVNLFAFGFQGALVGVAWANRRGYPRFVQILFGAMLLGAGVLPVMALAILGMLDTWWDFRRLTPPRGGAAPGSPGSASKEAGAKPAGTEPQQQIGRATKVVHQR